MCDHEIERANQLAKFNAICRASVCQSMGAAAITLQAVKTVKKTMTDENDYDEDNHEEGLIVLFLVW